MRLFGHAFTSTNDVLGEPVKGGLTLPMSSAYQATKTLPMSSAYQATKTLPMSSAPQAAQTRNISPEGSPLVSAKTNII